MKEESNVSKYVDFLNGFIEKHYPNNRVNFSSIRNEVNKGTTNIEEHIAKKIAKARTNFMLLHNEIPPFINEIPYRNEYLPTRLSFLIFFILSQSFLIFLASMILLKVIRNIGYVMSFYIYFFFFEKKDFAFFSNQWNYMAHFYYDFFIQLLIWFQRKFRLNVSVCRGILLHRMEDIDHYIINSEEHHEFIASLS